MKLMELYQDKIMGAMRGLDRIRFRGTLRLLANQSGMRAWMRYANILLKDFGTWAEGITKRIRQSCQEAVGALGAEERYLRTSSIRKDELARQIAQDRGITEGSICLLSIVEPCISPAVRGNKATQQLELQMAHRKCVWLYHYFDDPDLGFGHVRLQSWAPFNVFICLNGRHWLERQLQKQGIDYHKAGNGFPWIEDIPAAQSLLDQQLQTNWTALLNRLTFSTCPALAEVMLPLRPDYYWSADNTEWATDILFHRQEDLDHLYPSLVHHALRVSDSRSVMKYLGRYGGRGRLPQEVISDFRRRYAGVRIKHWVNHNSVKMYNKSGSILRIETTINHTREFKVFRHPDDDVGRPASWQKMRKGVCDLHRRCELSDRSNERYGDMLAAAQIEETLQKVVSPACNKIKKNGRRYRGLNPWQKEDYRLLAFLAKGENALSGFRNKDLRSWLYPESENISKPELKRYSGRTTRRIKLLRVHGLVKKVAKENRYFLTAKGQKLAVALMNASAVDIKGLTEMAA